MILISSLEGNRQSLDGGAMFGNVPRALWERWCPADELGRIQLSCRCFLVEEAGRKVLIETGVGSFFPPKLRQRYGVFEDEHVLLRSLEERAITPEEIDVVLLSHLHFDHAGGLLSQFQEGKKAELVFPRANILVGETAWHRARSPHVRDRASFIPELITLLERSGRLVVVPDAAERHALLGENISLRTSFGHTPGMILPTVRGRDTSATFCADLVPGSPWVHLPITMGYDRFPEQLIDEKRELYEDLKEGSWLLFTHDIEVAAGRLSLGEIGKYQLSETLPRLDSWEL